MLISLLLIPLIGVFAISTINIIPILGENNKQKEKQVKIIGLVISILNLFISLVLYLSYDLSSNQFQFVQEYYESNLFDIYLGIDGLSLYFVLLTTILIPISLLSN
jgi:NADH:ubiquinone oxidoreductase subunit 4 (subunit M)